MRSCLWRIPGRGTFSAVLLCFSEAAGTAPGDRQAVAADRVRGEAPAWRLTPA